MCHENWWREGRARRAEESREVWEDFERTEPAPPPTTVLSENLPAEPEEPAAEPEIIAGR